MNKQNTKIQKVKNPDKVSSYFKLEVFPLTLVTISGIIYNIGMTAGPYFEGRLAQLLFDIINHKKTFTDMVIMALIYLLVILIVQGMRCIKRFYVRRFANDTGKNMRHMLYNSLVYKSKLELEEESIGEVMTKAVSDVDACAEGMRKFTTEIFDTGVVLISYIAMLFIFDWKLALLSCLFPPIAYAIAHKLKKTVTAYNAAYKQSSGKLNEATMDRVSNAISYRVYGRESARDTAYNKHLEDYEKRAISANIWGTAMQPIYNIISMCGVIPILYFGAKNVLGYGWTTWNIAAFTTFLACFAKMAKKSSSAANLFNAVQKAQVSWKRIKPLMKEYIEPDTNTTFDVTKPQNLTVSHLSFSYKKGTPIIKDLSFDATPGQIIGITGMVASGKSTLGKLFLCERPYSGSIKIGNHELSQLSQYERSQLISYMGHEPQLISDTIAENIRLGQTEDVINILKQVRFDKEINKMPDGINTFTGSNGLQLSGGQQSRTALARTIYNGKQIFILDDPFSAVDKNTEIEIMNNLRNITKDKIVLLISHRLHLFPEFDKIIWIGDESEMVGNHTELIDKNPSYHELYSLQMTGGDLDET